MKFDATYQGAVMRGAGALYKYGGGTFYGTSAAVDDAAVTRRVALTGYYETSTRGNVGYQTTSGRYIILSDGWEKIGVQAIAQYSQTQAQAMVNKIIRNNKTILCNNLLCARYASKLTAEQQAQVRTLQTRLQTRNEALQSEGLTTGVKTSYPKGYVELGSYLDALMAGEAISIATWAALVITAVVIAATCTAAYYVYKAFADESEQDVKFSKELTATLVSKLTPEEYEQLKAETKDIVTKARIKSALGSYWNVLTWAALAFAGYTLYKYAKKRL